MIAFVFQKLVSNETSSTCTRSVKSRTINQSGRVLRPLLKCSAFYFVSLSQKRVLDLCTCSSMNNKYVEIFSPIIKCANMNNLTNHLPPSSYGRVCNAVTSKNKLGITCVINGDFLSLLLLSAFRSLEYRMNRTGCCRWIYY